MTTVASELQTATSLPILQGESPEDYTKRLVRKAAALSDDAWEVLEPDTQLWMNRATEALSKRQPLPLPPGIEELFEGVGGEEAPKGRQRKVARTVAPKAPPPAKAAPAAKAVKKAGVGRNVAGRKGKFTTDAVISLLVEGNPYRETSKAHGVFKKYKDGMTVTEAINAGIGRAYIRWDINHQHIEVSEPSD